MRVHEISSIGKVTLDAFSFYVIIGEMHIQSMPYFALTITFQKKELDHEEGIDCRGSEDAS